MNKFKFLLFVVILSLLFVFSCDPPTPSTHYADGEVRIWKQSNSPNAINIVVLGDGYIFEDLKKETGAFDVEVNKLLEFVFTKKPFSGYNEDFNVYVVYAKSVDRGADDSPETNNKNTAFNSSYNCAGIQRLLCIQNESKAKSYVLKAVDSLEQAHAILVSVNDERYGGSGGQYSVASTNSASTIVMIHEMGHSFGHLADEYVDEAIADNYPIDHITYYPNVDITDNLDTTDEIQDVKWIHFIGLEGYEGVGAYEGAYYRSTGVWRPEENCIMRALDCDHYCAPCRENIVKNICNIKGVAYDFQEFLEKDAVVLSFKKKSFFETFAKNIK